MSAEEAGGGWAKLDQPAPAHRLPVNAGSSLRLHRPRRSFPWVAPSWPAGVERPPVERELGVDYETDWARRYGVRLARVVLTEAVTRPALRLLASPVVDGEDRLASLDEPVIFAANHASHIDTPLLLTVLPERWRHKTVVAAGADYFFDKRWKAHWFAFSINAIPIERQRVSRKSADLAAELLQEGWSLIIFPEGGRTPDGWAQAHRPGAAWLSVRTGRPVVPVYLEGTRRILPKGGGKFRPGTVHVTFGAPMRPREGEDARELAVRIEDSVAALADEQVTDWWTARRRAAARATPGLGGPAAGAWRRSWALGAGRRRSGRRDAQRPWPDNSR